MRLLVVEDNQSLVANLFDYFEARGHVLDAAPDGPTGYHLASTQAYDALVLDWMLPRLDGREVLRRLREAGHDMPVLMLTARDELPDKIAGFRAGADDYLTKPFQLPELEVRIEALVARELPILPVTTLPTACTTTTSAVTPKARSSRLRWPRLGLAAAWSCVCPPPIRAPPRQRADRGRGAPAGTAPCRMRQGARRRSRGGRPGAPGP